MADPIPLVPLAQQRLVTRHDFEADWPFTVGEGILGCVDGAVLFRAGGVTYALNEAAARRPEAPAAVDAIRRRQGSGPPRQPLSRLTQDVRMRVFAEAMGCEAAAPGGAIEGCRRELRARAQVTDAELVQIQAEGRERSWPPLTAPPANVAGILEAGESLCGKAGRGR